VPEFPLAPFACLATGGFSARRSVFAFASPVLSASLVAVMTLSLIACSPAPVVPAQEPQLAGFATQSDRPASSAADVRWWQIFEDEQLNSLIARSLDNNSGLLAARARVEQYQAIAVQAGANRYPEVDITLGRSQTRNNGDLTANLWSAGLTTAYELDFWGRIASLEDKAVLDAAAQQRAARVEANTVAAQVSLAWYGLIKQQLMLTLLHEQQQRTEQLLAATQGRFQRGQSSAADIWQQQQLQESLKAEIAAADGQQRIYLQQLALWSARGDWLQAGDSNRELLNSLAARVLPSDSSEPLLIRLEALRQRPDVEQSWLALQSANASLAAAAANRYPRFTLSASITAQNAGLSSILDNWVSNLAANLLMPVFDAGNRKAAEDQQQAAARAALYHYEQTLLAAAQEVQEALVNQQTARLQLASIEQQLGLATRTEQYQTLGYQRGAVTYVALLNAQKSRLSLESQRLNAQWQLLQNRVQLYRSLSHADFADTTGSGASIQKVSE
jgi:NodT family efflux transporter outer membrane factor (OMF) lipoprotein